jgi:hypothetical protein
MSGSSPPQTIPADNLGGCWRRALREKKVGLITVILEDVSWEDGGRAIAEVSFACLDEGCARGSFVLERGPTGWRSMSERFCSDNSDSAFADQLPRCREG